MNNNVGYFNGAGLGDNLMFGTDGMHSDMLRSAQQAFFVGQGFDNIDYPSVYERFRKVHKYLGDNNFKGDGENNLVVLDYQSPTPITNDNFLGHFVFGFNASQVQHVISNGKLIVKNWVVKTVNEAEIMKASHIQAERLWAEMAK